MKPKEQSSYKNWSVSSQNWDQRQIHFLPLLYLFPIQIGFLQKRFTNSLYRDTRVYRVSCIIIERWLSDWSIQDPRWFVCTCKDRRLGCRVPHRRHLGRRRWKVFPQREFQFNSIEAQPCYFQFNWSTTLLFLIQFNWSTTLLFSSSEIMSSLPTRPQMVKRSWVKPGAVVIDCGKFFTPRSSNASHQY